MKTTVGRLRRIILDEAGKISASPEYMKKEQVRERLQQLIADRVAAGEVTDQASLDGIMKDVDMAFNALRMIPFEVWQQLTKKHGKR